MIPQFWSATMLVLRIDAVQQRRSIVNTTHQNAKPSRKARVRELYFEQGAEEAFTLGKRLKLKESTLHSWIGYWRREAAKAKAERSHARTEKRNATRAQRQAEGVQELAKAKEIAPDQSAVAEQSHA
jgi:hypothetical protein